MSKRLNDDIRTNRTNTVCEWSNSRIGKKRKMNVTFQDVVAKTNRVLVPSFSQLALEYLPD